MRLLPFALVLLAVVPARAWIVQVDGSGTSNRGRAVVIDPAGDVIVGGQTQSGRDFGDFTVAKLSRTDGRERWRTVLGDSATPSFVAALALTDAGVLAAGETADGHAVVQLATDTGAERWRGGDVVPAASVAVAPGGDVLVAGSAAATGFGAQRLDGATGAVRWSGGAGIDATAIAVSPIGDVVVAGSDGRDFVVVCLAPATGEERWRHVIPSPAGPADERGFGGAARAVAVGADGDAFVAGAVGNGRDTDAVVVRVDGNTGAERWRVTVAEESGASCDRCGTDDAFLAVRLDAAGDPVVTGFTGERFTPDIGPFTGSFTVMKLGRDDGATRWRFDSTPHGAEAGHAVAVDAHGDVLATGVTGAGDGCVFHSSPFQSTVCEFTVLKLAGDTGAELWRRVLPGLSQDAGDAIGVEPDGTAVATGTTGRFGADVGHFTVAALDPGGAGPDCGNGIVEPGEECDPIPNHGCCIGCRLAAAGTMCRAPTAACDPGGFCDGTTIECPLPVDAGDGICIAAAPCTDAVRLDGARAVVRSGRRAGVTLRGTLRLPFPFAPPLDPARKGIRIVVGRVDATVPGGAGWHRAGRTWRWASAPRAAGITRIVVRTSRRTPGVVRVRAQGRGPGFALSPGASLAIAVVLDPSGQCGTAAFAGPAPAPTCIAHARGRMLVCG